jgi:hypothetical protein
MGVITKEIGGIRGKGTGPYPAVRSLSSDYRSKPESSLSVDRKNKVVLVGLSIVYRIVPCSGGVMELGS